MTKIGSTIVEAEVVDRGYIPPVVVMTRKVSRHVDVRQKNSRLSDLLQPVVVMSLKVARPGHGKSAVSPEIRDCLVGPAEGGQP